MGQQIDAAQAPDLQQVIAEQIGENSVNLELLDLGEVVTGRSAQPRMQSFAPFEIGFFFVYHRLHWSIIFTCRPAWRRARSRLPISIHPPVPPLNPRLGEKASPVPPWRDRFRLLKYLARIIHERAGEGFGVLDPPNACT